MFNCTGVPVALRQVGGEGGYSGGEGSDAGYGRMLEDEVPESWLPPLDLPGQGIGPGSMVRSPSQSPLQARLGAAPSGLGAVSREGARAPPSALSTPTSAAPSVLGVSRGASTVDMAGLSDLLDPRSPAQPDPQRCAGQGLCWAGWLGGEGAAARSPGLAASSRNCHSC